MDDFKVYKQYASWQNVDYLIMGEMVFMNLCFTSVPEIIVFTKFTINCDTKINVSFV